MKKFKIFIIAEVACNHQGSIELAKKYIDEAKRCQVDAIKFQLYRAHEIQAYEALQVESGRPSLYTEEIFEGIKETEFTIEQMRELKEHCDAIGIEYMCTPFVDAKYVDQLESIDVTRYKIRQRDSDNMELIKRALDTRKQVIISTTGLPLEMGLLYHPQIKWMYCIPKYPPKLEDMPLQEIFVYEGFSDHYPHISAALAACSVAKAYKRDSFIIEKHFTISHSMNVLDSAVSIDPQQLKALVTHVRRIEQIG